MYANLYTLTFQNFVFPVTKDGALADGKIFNFIIIFNIVARRTESAGDLFFDVFFDGFVD